MRTVTINIYNYSELSPKAKEKAKAWLTEDVDLSATVEDFEKMLEGFGVSGAKIYYRGFWSQGDGACFVGTFRSVDFGKKGIHDFAPNNPEILRIEKVIKEICSKYPSLTAKIQHSGHYYHEYSVNFDFSDSEFWDTELEEAFRDLMKWIYKSLEEEYNFLTSEEVVAETMTANNYFFTEGGQSYEI